MKSRGSRWAKFMRVGAFGVLGALTLMAGQARATGNLFHANNPNPQVFGCGMHTLDLNGAAPGTNLPVTLVDTDRLVVLFNGEYAANGTADTWVGIDIRVLNAAGGLVTTIAPTADDNAFCTSGGEHWVSAATNGVSIPLGPGAYQVQVQGILQNGCVVGNTWTLDDLSTIVLVQ
jgi:hypothetical protein